MEGSLKVPDNAGTGKSRLEDKQLKVPEKQKKVELEKERGRNSVLANKLVAAKKEAEKAQRYFDTINEVRTYIDAFISRRKNRIECTKQNKIGF